MASSYWWFHLPGHWVGLAEAEGGAVPPDGLTLNVRAVVGHDDGRTESSARGCVRQGLSMVATAVGCLAIEADKRDQRNSIEDLYAF